MPDWACRTEVVAGRLKAHFDIDENLWSTASYDAVELVTEESIFEKAAYCISNPTAAGLVASWRKWPGVVSRPEKGTDPGCRSEVGG